MPLQCSHKFLTKKAQKHNLTYSAHILLALFLPLPTMLWAMLVLCFVLCFLFTAAIHATLWYYFLHFTTTLLCSTPIHLHHKLTVNGIICVVSHKFTYINCGETHKMAKHKQKRIIKNNCWIKYIYFGLFIETQLMPLLCFGT